MKWKDGRGRCSWCNPNNERYLHYHDEEWGVPVYEDAKLFELLVLESFQAGLSWECVLNKREAFRAAMDGFDPVKVAAYGPERQEALAQNRELIRNRRKIAAAVDNAKVFLEIQNEFGRFSTYLWGWTDGKQQIEQGKTHSVLSDALSADLKRRGMRFVGTTIVYAYLQAVGVIYAHEPGCFLEKST